MFEVGPTLLATLNATQGVRITGSCPTPQGKRPRPASAPSYALSLNSSCHPVCQRIPAQSRDAMQGTTHQPEDLPYGGFGLRCCPPLSHGSSRFEVGRFELPTAGSAPLLKVEHCGILVPLRPSLQGSVLVCHVPLVCQSSSLHHWDAVSGWRLGLERAVS